MALKLARIQGDEPKWGLDRIVYPRAGFTLRDVVDYYKAVASFILPHLKSHPLTLKRYPDEVAGEVFYEKDAPAFTPSWVKRHAEWRRTGDSQIDYIVVKDRRALLWAASVGTVEFHTFLGTDAAFDQPTAVVFDLDPGEGADIVNCAQIALLLRDLLEKLQLQSLVKVSGSKGLQLYVPLNVPVSFTATQSFAKTVAALMAEQNPNQAVSEMVRNERRGRVFIDWSQNADYKTTVSVYSLRAKRTTPFVSMPVTWTELETAVATGSGHDLYFHPDAALQRLATTGDLFLPVTQLKQRLPEAFTAGSEPRKAPRPRKATTRAIPLKASRQGSRRRFWFAGEGGTYRLQIEFHNTTLGFSFSHDLPRHTGQHTVARLTDPSTPAASIDDGSCELIEGSFAKGHLLLHLRGQKLNGSWLIEGSANNWSIQKI